MDILALHPCLRPQRPHTNFPIGPAYVLSALSRAGRPFRLLDLEAERLDEAEIRRRVAAHPCDVLLLGTLVTGYAVFKRLAALVREIHPRATIVAGNSVASSVHGILLTRTAADIAVFGEADETIVDLLDALERGRDLATVAGIAYREGGAIRRTAPRPVIASLDAIPTPDWELFDMERYIRGAMNDVPEPYPRPKEEIRPFTVNTARGCPFQCTFCYHVFRDVKYRMKSPGRLLDEIEGLNRRYGINFISFHDELTFSSKRHLADFLAEVRRRKLDFHWIAAIRADLFGAGDVALAREAREAGCVALGYSLESGDPEILRAMNKRLTVEDFVAQKRTLDAAGIPTFTSLVLGYPEETLETIRKTFDVCHEIDLYPSSGYLLPQPGTPMYDLARERGLIPDEEEYLMRLGDRQDLRINLTRIPDDAFQAAVKGHLARIAKKVGLPFHDESLVRTGTYVLNTADLADGDPRAKGDAPR